MLSITESRGCARLGRKSEMLRILIDNSVSCDSIRYCHNENQMRHNKYFHYLPLLLTVGSLWVSIIKTERLKKRVAMVILILFSRSASVPIFSGEDYLKCRRMVQDMLQTSSI